MGYLNPMSSFAGNTAALLSGRSNTTVNSLKAFGINSYMRSPGDVASQLLARFNIKPGQKLSAQAIQMMVRDPNMGLGGTLQQMVQSGAMTQDYANSIQDAAYANLVGAAHGYSSSQVQDMLSKAGNGDSGAQSTLKSLGIGTTTEQTARNKNAHTTESSEAQLDSFAWSLKVTTSAMNALNTIIRKIPGVSQLAGANSGSGGLLGKIGDIALPFISGGIPGALSGLLHVGGEGGDGQGASFSTAGFSGYGGFSEAATINAALSGGGVAAFQDASGSSSSTSSSNDPSASPIGNWGGSTGSGGTTAGGSVSTSGPGGNASQMAIVNTAKKYLGVKYVWGGSTPKGFDCSGLVCYVLNQVGVHVPRTTAAGLSKMGSPVGSLKDAQPGDMVFFGSGSISHVGIYVGGGRMIDAPHTGSVVRYDPVAGFNPPFRLVRRFVHGTSKPTTTHGSNGDSITTSGNGASVIDIPPGSSASAGGKSHNVGGGNRQIVNNVAGRFGWGGGSEWSSLAELVSHESSWNNRAQNPHSTAYGLFQFLDSTWAGTGIKKTSDPTQQSIAGMRYIKSRYGDPNHAWSFWKKHNWYDKGAWQIKEDEDARLHKDEMVIPKGPADQIRQVLLQNNTTSGGGKKATSSGGIVFKENSVHIHIDASSGVSAATGRGLGQQFAQAVAEDSRIKALLAGDN
jgi:cell wall-associated NlpC family hydrolase